MTFDVTNLLASFGAFLPEAVLGLFFVIALVIDALSKQKRLIAWWALAGYAIAGWLAYARAAITPDGLVFGILADNPLLGDWTFPASTQAVGEGMLVIDTFAIFFKVLIVASALLVTIFSLMSRELDVDGKPRLGEYYSLMIAMTFGMFLMVGANDMILMYLGIEIVSLASYSIVGFTKNVARSSEAAMKYVIYGGVSSGVMLFGISLVYGLVGTTNFGEMLRFLGSPNTLAAQINPFLVASLMIVVGLGYKISAAPFHFWTPDVYEGAPITMTAFLSVASKAAGFALLIRFVVSAYPPLLEVFDWKPILAMLAVLTMTLGNLAALQQSNIKRLLAYSSIAHAGYMLLGLVVGTTYGVSAILVYFAIYLVMNLGGFFAVQKIAEQIDSEEIDDYRGLGPRMPVVGVLFGVFMIALVGLPPTAGFIGKFFLFSSLLEGGSQYVWLAVVAVINSVISLYYYVRVLKVMYLDKPISGETAPVQIGGGSTALLGALAIATIMLGLPNFFGPLLALAQNSLGTLARLLHESGAGTLGGG